MNKRQAIPLITDARTVVAGHAYRNEPSVLREDDAITRAFARAREAVERLEERRLEHVGGEWSPSQFAMRGAA